MRPSTGCSPGCAPGSGEHSATRIGARSLPPANLLSSPVAVRIRTTSAARARDAQRGSSFPPRLIKVWAFDVPRQSPAPG